MDQKDIDRVQAHLKRTFGNPHIAVKARPKQKDSAEVEMKGEFIGVIYEDEDEAGSFLRRALARGIRLGEAGG